MINRMTWVKKLEKAKKFEMDNRKIDETEFYYRLKMAELWHNPFNAADGGQGIKKEFDWKILFDDAREYELGTRSRYYFKFKEFDMTNIEVVAYKFYNCSNYKRYLKVWKQYAPEEFNSEVFFLYSLCSFTVRGFDNENKIISNNGWKKSSFEEDYINGIDAFDKNGNPQQIKSPGTNKVIKKQGEWDKNGKKLKYDPEYFNKKLGEK